MSKKVVAFALPQEITPHPEMPPADPLETLRRINAEAWVGAEPEAAAPAPEPDVSVRPSGPTVIDLSARRSFPELVELVCIFPWLATWAWSLQMTEEMLKAYRPR
jgi:hypothetical protein